MHMYNGYHFGGMHLIWWLLWVIFIFWVFATPYDIPGQRKKKDTPLDILNRRYASGEMNTDDFEARKKVLAQNAAR